MPDHDTMESSFLRLVICFLVGVVAFAVNSHSITAEDWSRYGTPNQQVFVEREVLGKLWELELFQDCIDQCQAGRSLSAAGSDPQARWTMWWIETIANQAVIDRNARTAAEANIEKIVSDFQADKLNERRKHWIAWQGQLGRLLIAQGHLADYLAAPTRTESREATLKLAREILEQCEGLQTQVEPILAIASKTTRDRESVAPVNEVQTLVNEILLLKIEALLVRSQCYPPNNPDSVAYGAEMLALVEQASQRIASDWFGRPRLDLFRCEALIQMGRLDDAIDRIENLLQEPIGDSLRWSVIARASEAHRLKGNFAEAQQALDSAGTWEAAPQIAIETMRLIIVQSQDPKSLQDALDLKDRIGQRFGSHWKQRAEAVLISKAETKMSAGAGAEAEIRTSLELLKTEATQLLRANRIDEAIDRLKQASAVAEKNQLRDDAFDLGLKIAALLSKKGEKLAAADQFASSAMAHPEHSKASASHLMSAWMVTEHVKGNQTIESELIEKLRSRLYAQIKQWPTDDNARTARGWLDHSLLSSGMLPESALLWIESFEGNGDQGNDMEMAVSRVLLLAMIARVQSPLAGKIELAGRLDQSLRTLYDKSSDTSRSRILVSMSALREFARDDRWNSVDQGFPMFEPQPEIANIASMPEGNGFAKSLFAACKLINAARSGEKPSDEIVAELWQSIAEEDSQRATFLLPITDSLFGVISDRCKADRDAWAKSLNEIAKQTESVSLGGPSGSLISLRIKAIRASLVVWQSSGNFNKPFETLEATHAKNPAHVTAKAMALRDVDTPNSIKLYQRLAAGVPQGSPWWFEARLRTAQIYATLDLDGQSRIDQARQIIDLLSATFPDADPQWLKRSSRLISK
jgi:tetratricopeptide (TPR) repeat protein